MSCLLFQISFIKSIQLLIALPLSRLPSNLPSRRSLPNVHCCNPLTKSLRLTRCISRQSNWEKNTLGLRCRLVPVKWFLMNITLTWRRGVQLVNRKLFDVSKKSQTISVITSMIVYLRPSARGCQRFEQLVRGWSF